MRKFVLFFFTLLISMASMGQTAAQYTFAATSGTYTALSGATPVTVTGSADEGYYSGIPIGFNFTFAGTVYTQINVSTNGWLTLGTSGSPNTITTAGLTNSFASLYSTPTIAPLWDDNALSSVTGISYISAAGTAGNRITTIQYSTYLWNYNAASGVLEFQVRFYENGNKLDFIYHQLATAPNSASASIGIASANNVFLALDGSGTNPNASTTINTVTIAAKPAEGQIYTFTPPIAGTPNPPTTPNPADLATGVPVSGTCTWTFGTNTTTYDLKFGPTGSMVQVVTGAAAGANGTYTYSGLTPSVGYQWQVIEHNGALAYTGPTWNFTTACVPYATFPWTENFDAMGTVGVGLLPACWASSSPSGTPWYTGNAASITYNDPCSSPNYVYCYYIPSASDKFLFTPGFTLTAGSTYNFSFNWVGDGYSGWTGDVLVNSAQSGTGATALGASFLLPATTTTTVCTPAARTFIPATTGTYYFMIRVNNSSVPYYLGFDDFSLSVLLPCSTPPAQPTALVLTPSTMSVNGSFTAAAGTDKYLVVRSLSSTLSTPPVNGTTYTVGQALGNGFVDSYGATTTFTSTSLTPATPYYYFIFAANDVSCGGGPNYRTATPLTGNTTTVALVPISGNKTVGPTGDFFTLTAAFAYLNSNGVNGPLNLILQSTYVSSVEPAFPIPVLPIPAASAINKTTVYPSASGLSITSASTTGTINMNGNTFVIFDGRVNATGSTSSLVIENSSTTGYTIQFVNGASNNAIQYCVVKGASTSLANGTITFASTTGMTGNNNNLIDNCEIRDGVSAPAYAVYSSGSASPLAFNQNNTVSNCLIHDFYTAAGGNPIGIAIMAGSTAWTISGNSFYMTTAKSPTVAVGYNVIFLAAGDGYSILNNYIGGSAPLCGGTPWTLNGNGTPPTIANFIYAIRFAAGVTVNPSTVQGNTVANMVLYTNPTAASIYFVGLLSAIGVQNISNNTFGSATGTGSISITVGNGAYATTYEGIDYRGNSGNVTNNTFGSFTISGATGSTSTYALTVRPFSVTPSYQNGAIVVSGNLAGSLTTANSIQTPVMAYPPMQLQAFFISAAGAGTMSVSNNTVANINNLSSYNGSHIVGIYSAGTALPNTLSGNTIRDLSTSSTNTTIAGIASIAGIYSLNSVPGSVIRSNNIYNLTNTDGAAAAGIHGIYSGHTAGNLLIEKNFIHNVGMASSSATAQVTGMYLNNSGAYVTVKNNMLQLGVNPDGSANTSSDIINGIYESGATVDSILNNSVFIGGGPGAVTTGNTYAFNSVLTPSLSTPRVCMDNIFYNARSGGLTGKHYGIKIAGTTIFPLGVTSNYNLVIANGATGGTFGYFNAADQATFAAYKGATNTEMASGNADPNFVAPTGNTATANLHVQSPTPIEGAGKFLSSVTDDFDGAARSGLTPTDVGADAGNYTLSADVFGPNISYVAMGNGTTANRVLTNWATITDNVGVSTGASLPRIYFKKSTDADVFGGNTSADNGWKYVIASNSSSPFSFTINYGIINTGAVVAGDIIQYFVVAQDAANNLSSNYLMAGASANPPVQNINAKPANFQTYTIVAGTIPTTITVPGTYATLTATGGAFDMINQGVLAGNTTINITGDLTEPGTVALNAWAEDVPGANYTLTIKPDATTLRTISGTAVATGVAMIRTNGASRFTIDGQAGKYLTFRNTNATAGNTGPTIQFNGGSQNCFLKNSTIENNGTTTTYGTVNIGTTGINTVEINGNNIGDATGGTIGIQTTGIYNSTFTNSLRVINNNIYNFKNYGLYCTTVADGAVVTGNSFYYNSATASTATQYCIYLIGSSNGHTISNNYFGGQSPLCAGSAWTNSSTNSVYGTYLTLGIASPATISGNTFQNFNNASTASLYGIYFTAGVANILNNMIGSTTVPGSITGAGSAGYFYGIYGALSTTAPSSIQGNTVTGLNYNNSLFTGGIYLMGLTGGLVKVGTVTPNILGSNTVAGSITMVGTGSLYGLYLTSTSPANAVENNIIGNWSLTGTTGSPYARGMWIYSANVKKNKIFNITTTNAGLTPYIYGIYIYGTAGITNEYSNNLITLDGGLATNPVIYGIYDGSYTTDFFNLYYNSVYITGPATGTSTTYAFYRGVAAFYTVNNNIFANNRVAGGTGKHYAAYISSTGVWSSNYNDLYSASGTLGYYNAADQLTMAAWKLATSGDANSPNVDPLFVSSTDLHTTKPELNNSGIAIPAVTTDYAGITRGATPDIGAYEFTGIPVVTTTPATAITFTGATLNGTVMASNEIVITSFDYGLSVAYGTNITAVPVSVTGLTTTAIAATITLLNPCTVYHYRAKGMIGATPYYGLDMTFTTGNATPTPLALAATLLTGTTATLNGTVNANGLSTTVTFDYGLTVAYGTTVPGVPSPVTGVTPSTVLAAITGLIPATTYHYRVNGTNTCGTGNSPDMTFTTPAVPAAVITTAATAITATSATLNGTINANNSATTVSFDYGLTIAYGTNVPGVPLTISGTTVTASLANLTSLLPNTLYHFRINGVNAGGTTNGNDLTFTTATAPPTVTTTAATPVGTITATLNGIVNANNLSTTVTFDYGTTIAYGTTVPGVPSPVTGSAPTNVSAAIVGLITNTTYHFRVNGTNTAGTSNGGDLTFQTGCPIPSAAGTITGPAAVCLNGTGYVYTVPSIPNATTYNWSLPTGASITAGANTNSITVSYSGTAVSGNITVTGSSICGSGTVSPNFAVTVSARPTPTITGPVSVCALSTGNIYTTQAGMSGYTWTVPTGGTITAGAGTNAITVTWNTVGAQTVTVNYNNAGGCAALTPTIYNVTVNALPVPTITGPATVCASSTGNVYTTQAGMTGYVWSLSAGGTITTGTGTNSITVTWLTAGTQTVCVNYANASGCTAAAPVCNTVTVNALPAPTITGPASVCVNSTTNVYTTQAGMTGYTWTVSAGGNITAGSTTNSITVTWTTAGAKTVTVNYTNASSCTASAPTSYAVTVNALPVPTITGTATVCQYSTGVVYTTQAGMTNYVWTVSAGGIVTAGGTATSNTVTVTWNTPGVNSVSVNYTNGSGCTAATAASFGVTVNATPVPTIGSNNAPCVGSTGNMYYTEGGMTGYVWTVSTGGAIVSGQGTSAINVTWTGVGAQWVSVNYVNGTLCTAPTATVYNLFVNPMPNAAGAITGTATLCAGTNGVAYSCAEILNASTYTWTLPAGATIATGAGTKSITVNFATTAVSGNITVSGTNSCGNGTASPAFAVTVNPLPADAGTITGPASVCVGSTGVTYSVTIIANATSYVWTVPAGATITSGGTTRTIVVTYGATAGTGVVSVKGTNTCGNGAVSSLNVTIHAIPAAPVVTANGAMLTSSASAGNQWYYEGNAIAGATGQTYTVTHNTGYYWVVVTVNGCSSPLSNKVWVVMTGQAELNGSSFNLYPVPNDGRFTLTIASPVQETFTIVIYNQLGAKIYELGDVQVNGTFEKQVDLRPIANGIYSVVFLNSEHKVVKKVLVNK